jgi:hypothetical protein
MSICSSKKIFRLANACHEGAPYGRGEGRGEEGRERKSPYFFLIIPSLP